MLLKLSHTLTDKYELHNTCIDRNKAADCAEHIESRMLMRQLHLIHLHIPGHIATFAIPGPDWRRSVALACYPTHTLL